MNGMTVEQKRQYITLAAKSAFRHHDYLTDAVGIISHLENNAVEYVYFHVMKELKTQPADNWKALLQDALLHPKQLPKYN